MGIANREWIVNNAPSLTLTLYYSVREYSTASLTFLSPQSPALRTIVSYAPTK